MNPPPAPDELSKLIELHGSGLPIDYLNFIAEYDGANGEVGDNYLSIYTVAEILKVAEATPSNGFLLVAATGYFHYGVRAQAFYELDLMEDSYQVAMGKSFVEFLQNFEARTWDDK